MTVPQKFLSAAAVLVVVISFAVISLGEHRTMSPSEKLLGLVDGLAGRQLTSSNVARQLGVVLQPVAQQSDEYTLVYAAASDAERLFESVELRLPGPESDNMSQLLALGVGAGFCLTMADVQSRHGQGELSVPTPRQPVDARIHLVYRKDWGRLSFGFEQQASRCLKEVVIDVQPAPAK